MNNPRFPQGARPTYSWTSGHWVLLVLVLIALGVGGAALGFAINSFSGGGESATPLSLADNTTQRLLGSDVWTHIRYHQTIWHSDAWRHTNDHHRSSLIVCERAGSYSVYLSVQTALFDDDDAPTVAPSEAPTGVPTEEPTEGPTTEAPTAAPTHSNDTCRACHLRYEIRAVQQLAGTGPFLEVRPSYTVSNRDDSFLSKLFIVRANPGDVLIMQVKSRCRRLILTPLGDHGFFNSYPSSATLAISS